MTILISQFQVVETYISRPYFKKFWQWLIGCEEIDQYHFDVRIKIQPLPQHLQLREQDIVMLDNGVRLIIWSRDRKNMFKAKTIKMVVEDIRSYKPVKMHLVYPRTYMKINY